MGYARLGSPHSDHCRFCGHTRDSHCQAFSVIGQILQWLRIKPMGVRCQRTPEIILPNGLVGYGQCKCWSERFEQETESDERLRSDFGQSAAELWPDVPAAKLMVVEKTFGRHQ